jgi:hypothetical protein
LNIFEPFTSFDEVGSSTSTWFLSQAVWGALDDAVGNNKSPLGQERAVRSICLLLSYFDALWNIKIQA